MRAADNPFTVQKVRRIRYRLSDQTWEGLLERLAALRYRAAIVGPHGRGKTTLLEDLAPHLEARGFRIRSVMLHTGNRLLSRNQTEILFRDLKPGDLLCVDGAEQLRRASWLTLMARSRGAGGLLITSHRPGLLPTLVECATSFRPGETVEGTVRWQFPEPPEEVELRLFWSTSGKGDQDLEIMQVVPFGNPGAQDRRTFRVRLPEGPYSFSGKLITLAWALEAVAQPGDRSGHLELVLSPTGEEIRLLRQS